MVVTPLWVWRVFVHLRSNRIPCLQGLTSAQEECLAGSKDFAIGGARFEILRWPMYPKTRATLSGTNEGSVSQMATSLIKSSLVTADLWSGWSPAD